VKKFGKFSQRDKNRRKKNRGIVKNQDTSWDFRISREGETNTISHAGSGRLSEYGLSGIKELIENAVFLDSEVHEHHSNNAVNDYITFNHKFYSLGEDNNGNIGLYKIAIEEFFQSKTEPANKKFHNLKYVEKIADNVGGRTFEKTRSGGSTNDTSATYSISDLFEFVKRYDPEFKPVNVVFERARKRRTEYFCGSCSRTERWKECDKGKKQFLYEMKFIENKESSQQSTTASAAPTAPKGDVENDPILTHKKPKVNPSGEKSSKKDPQRHSQ